MSSDTFSPDPTEYYQVIPTYQDKISDLVDKKRFKNQDHFIDRAIEVFLAWENDPEKAMDEMTKIEPTVAQYVHLIMMGTDYDQLKKMYPKHPDKFGSEWIEFLTSEKATAIGLEDKFEKSKAKHSSQSDKRASHKDYEHAIAQKTSAINFLKNQDFSKLDEDLDEFKFDEWPLLFTHYSRIFPAKVAVLGLATLMDQQQRSIVNFENFTEMAYDLCEEISDKQGMRESKQKVSRENKISTGLPKVYRDENPDDSQIKYENRYKERYFGKIKRNRADGKQYFEGLMSALGLIRIFKIKKEYHVTFTEKGKEFLFLDNPIFDGEFEPKSFSDKEIEYVLEHLISERRLEINLMNSALNLIELKEGTTELTVSQLDEEFEYEIQKYCDSAKDSLNFERLNDILKSTEKIKNDIINAKKEVDSKELKPIEKENLERITKKQTPIQAIRVATMGRMSELNLVEWEIEGGKSSFKLGNSELIKIIKKQTKN
jgi:hypothetical protein